MARRVQSKQLALSGAAESLNLDFGEQTAFVTIRSATGNSAAYLGDSTVSASTGFLLAAGETLRIDTGDPDHMHIIGTATDVVYVLAVAI